MLEMKRGELCELKSWGEKAMWSQRKLGGKEQEKCTRNVLSVFISLEIPLKLLKCGQL